jgi:hypothetical protein
MFDFAKLLADAALADAADAPEAEMDELEVARERARVARAERRREMIEQLDEMSRNLARLVERRVMYEKAAGLTQARPRRRG